jgi:hypothetical protein
MSRKIFQTDVRIFVQVQGRIDNAGPKGKLGDYDTAIVQKDHIWRKMFWRVSIMKEDLLWQE